jgi:hypothetical protein
MSQGAFKSVEKVIADRWPFKSSPFEGSCIDFSSSDSLIQPANRDFIRPDFFRKNRTLWCTSHSRKFYIYGAGFFSEIMV